MAKGKAKKKAKVKAKGKTKAKAKTKASVKTKPKVQAKAQAKSKAKPKPKLKAKAKGRHNGPPPVNKPDMCDSFTAVTNSSVLWQHVPPGGCIVAQLPNTIWPFSPASPISVPYLNPGQTPNATIIVGTGTYPIDVQCCQSQMPKIVTVP
jgi:hypothetical protein